MAEDDIQPRRPPPHIYPIFLWPTPEKQDLLFYVERDGRLPENKEGQWAYGQPYRDQVTYPDHKLVYVSPQSDEKWSRWYYASDRINEPEYNWEITEGEALIRTYLVPRVAYRERPDTTGSPDPGEWLWPPVATPDDAFPLYGFADDTVVRTETELDSIYVVVRRRFLIPEQTNILYDDAIEHNVSVTKQLVGKDFVLPASVAGIQSELEYGNRFHDWAVTSTVLLGEDDNGDPITYPVSLTGYIADVPYKFPPLLKSARIVAAWAIADSDSAARSYDESWYYKWNLVDPMIGPYEARVLRFLTSNPDALRASYPIQKIVTNRELIGIARSWAHASSKGNSTYAEARQIEVPPSIHDEITIENGETLSVGQSTNILPATPNFGTVVGRSTMIIAYETKQTRFGLYEVEITELNCTGVYNGVVVPFGSTYTPGVPLPDMGANDPPLDDTDLAQPSATISADNTTVSGQTSPNASVKVFNGSTEVGRAMANTSIGSYSLVLDVTYTDATALTVRAYLNGNQSDATALTTYDLRPERPSGYLNSAGTVLQGTTEPSATVNILLNASPQVETATLPAYYPQVETLTFAGTITADGDIPVDFVSALVVSSVTIPATTVNTMAELAELARVEFNADLDLTEHWTVTRSGDDLIFTAVVSAADDATAEAEITDPNVTGITPAVSANTVVGGADPVLISVAGTAIATVTSGIAPWGTLNVPFNVAVSDTPTNVATKAAAALALSPVADYYTPGSSTNNATITALAAAADDPVLNIAITAGTCEGLVNTPAISTSTTPGGTYVSVLANAAGAYAYTFPEPLTPGDQIQVTASDGGGTSLPLLLEAAASYPTLSSATLGTSPNTNIITGSATIGAKIIAYVGDTDVGDTTVGGGGTYSLTLDYKMVRGERIQVVAVVVANEDVRSAPLFITASDLNLVIPSVELTDAGYVGDMPAGADEVRVRRVSDLTEAIVVTEHTNGTFSFSLAGEAAGAAFDVYARYPQGDSDALRIFVPTVPKMAPYFDLRLSYVHSSWGPGESPVGYYRKDPNFFFMGVAFQTWVDGMDVTISYPGSDNPDIVISNFGADRAYYDPDDYSLFANISYPNGNRPANAYRGTITLPLDETSGTPLPYSVVKVTLSYPDGDTIEATFNASSFTNLSWRNGDWNYGWLADVTAQTNSGNYYQPPP